MSKPQLEFNQEARPAPGLSVNDVLFMLFRQRRAILLCTAIGMIAAGIVYIVAPRLYESKAKLLVRYVVDNSTLDRIEGQLKAPSGDTVLNSEVQILNSYDLALEVADAIGPERLLAGKGVSPTQRAAAGTVKGGMTAVSAKGGNTIEVSYKNENPDLAVEVLVELVQRYFQKHLEVHRSGGAFDFVAEQAEKLKLRLRQTEEVLKKRKAEAGIAEITSLSENTATLNAGIRKGEEELLTAQADLAGQLARVQEMEKWVAGADAAREQDPTAQINNKVAQYQSITTRLAHLRQTELELLSKYTPANRAVQVLQEQIAEFEAQCRQMERLYPGLVVTRQDPAAGQQLQTDLLLEKGRVISLHARIDALKAQQRSIQELAAKQSGLRSEIADLERKREADESNYKYYQASLEKARVDEALDPSKIPNISVVQRPSPAVPVTSGLNKVLFALVMGGFGMGVGGAFLFEMAFDRTIKRRTELERLLGIPVLCSIPLAADGRSVRSRLGDRRTAGSKAMVPNGHATIFPWDPKHFVRPFTVAIRDRLVLFFELNRMIHKPKLISVSGFSSKAGSSTIAAGLAAALSEVGDGKVLVVDMNVGRATAHPFFEGRPACSLAEALKGEDESAVTAADDNLFLATALDTRAGPKNCVPKVIENLVPEFKASDFDYVIFDMPPFGENTTALAMSRFMDKILLVVEADVSNRDLVKRGYDEFVAARANVSTILNKHCCESWMETVS